MKYRRLTLEELSELEQDFIQFLSANGIPGPDWEKIKEDDPAKAEGLIELFSDIIFDKTLDQIEYLEYKTPKDIKIFHCEKHKIVMNGLLVDGKSDIDFTQAQDPEEMSRLLASSGAKLKIYTAQKKYHPNRKMELFKMMEDGALISRDGALFKTLESLKG
ncbi:DUF6495 family protein [Flavilitoribacter nigricans]|uniref:Uncharacterized protein n=1 Tax=Flavilitoribacter nigricans (strain ATCC 23147 / DSM 23189 / NBRC 102662 / NCIMB 1420 / SS-2) TaxID=1122177 RepID=A0A2D0NBJ7_FLAN2|nr:DUF6495 family protein [Flavilitoribacter nigricans]PHN05766.1 hypothetical protein CRP01_14925 [Flavilitoribacter nigricans DSM 23189 = NBRC 102662]